MMQIRVNRPEHVNVPETNTNEGAAVQQLEPPCVRSGDTGGASETDRDLLWSLEDVLLPAEHGKSLMSRALTPGLWTI